MKNNKNIVYSIFIFGFLALIMRPLPTLADSVLHEGHTPAMKSYTSYCDGNYHGLNYCNFTDSFSFPSDQIASAITIYDLGCNSRDGVEIFLSYRLVNADNDNIVAESVHNRHLVCTPDYPVDHNIPTTLEINPVRLLANQRYYIMFRALNGPRIRAYWGVDWNSQTSYQIHGSPAPKDPTILVPGIMGSSMKRVFDGREIWPNVNEMVMSAGDNYLDDLKLNASGNQILGKELLPDKMLEQASFSIFGQNLVTQTFYGDLVRQFTDRGYTLGMDLFELAYDWRMDLSSEVSRLESIVASAVAASPSGKVNLVAHSMGGLLVKKYLSIPANASLVNKVVLVGAPQLGAPSMFKVLSYGDNLGMRFPIIKKDILNPAKVKAIAQNMPGAYELLPSRSYVATAGGYVKDFQSGNSKTLSYDETAAFMTASSSDSRNSALILAGQNFHDGLDGQSISGPNVYNLAVCGNPATVGEIRLYDKGKIDIAGMDGDGTVPLASAMHLAGNYTNYFISAPVTGIDHGTLVKDSRATTLIERLVEGADIPVSSGIATTSNVCVGDSGVDTFRFSTHSPVALHVYDSVGRHIGPSSNGDIELGIEGGSYTTLGENSFIFVPAGNAYRVVVDGLAGGKFDLKAQTMQGSRLAASINYLDVPLAGENTMAEAVFSSADQNPILMLDSNGDGTTDLNIAPTARLFDAVAEDSEPPQIIVSGVPTGTIAVNTPFVVNFSASDFLSGVATTSATLDGAQFVSGATLSSPAAGARKIVIQAVDKAGNPKVFTAEFIQTAAPTQPNQPTQSNPPAQQNPPQQSTSGAVDRVVSRSTKSTVATSTAGKVLGTATTTKISTTVPVCLTLPSNSLGRGRANSQAEVMLLQELLNRELKLNIPVTGFFGPITELAVKIFQLKYYADVLAPAGVTVPTGFVGKYTLIKMGALACA